MAGSLMVISIGLIKASQRTCEAVIFFWSISDCERILSSPVNLRSRRARRWRIFAVEVSGRKKNKRNRQGPHAILLTYSVSCNFWRSRWKLTQFHRGTTASQETLLQNRTTKGQFQGHRMQLLSTQALRMAPAAENTCPASWHLHLQDMEIQRSLGEIAGS